jgi:pantetheine-phosphate adenylyltransferase
MKIAVFPGSFDPFTKGHEDIIRRALPLFDKIIIGIGVNIDKKYMFPIRQREEWLKTIFKGESKIKVMQYQGLTVDFCKKVNASYILRGLRTSADFEFERRIAHVNKAMEQGVETVYIISDPSLTFVASSIIRDILRNGGDASQFVPAAIKL